jgi:hypothetical protein
MRVWLELNQQRKNFGWLRLAKRQRPFPHGLSPELTVKLGITLSKGGIGEPEK